MKITYDNSFPGEPRYHLQPENSQECRFLTILRDTCIRPDVVIRVLGSEDLGTTRPGLPANPVGKLGIAIHGDYKKDVELDPSKPPPAKESHQKIRKPPSDEIAIKF
jgi:hypothetical protein